MSRYLLLALSTATAVLMPITDAGAADVGVSMNIGQPGFFGRIDIGNVPPPVIYAQPMMIAPAPAVMQRPIYLRVPPGHAKHWSKHCGKYNACDQHTYFVQEDWYRTEYAPSRGYRHEDARYHQGHVAGYRVDRPGHDDRWGNRNGDGKGHGKGHGKGDGRGHGKSHGNGHGKGH